MIYNITLNGKQSVILLVTHKNVSDYVTRYLCNIIPNTRITQGYVLRSRDEDVELLGDCA
jgi:hypothetical protein